MGNVGGALGPASSSRIRKTARDGNTVRQTELLAAIYCPKCQLSVAASEHRPVCPECGCALQHSAVTSAIQTSSTTAGGHDLDRLIGSELAEYRIDALLGYGGMGRVYLATHRQLKRSCALKILLPELAASDPAFVARFQNEGQAAAELVHPNIITIHAIGEEGGLHFLEMEFVAGRSLQSQLDDDGPPTLERATALALRVAEGLSVAHQRGILHRDLKPDNVLLTHQGIPKLADFGLAKRVMVSPGAGSTEIVGTPPYMAPELFQGQPASPASDVYALGVAWFRMITGQLPFQASQVNELMRQVLHDRLPNVRELCPQIPLEVSESLYRMLDRTPENRPANGAEVAHLLQAVLGETEDLESLLQQAFARSANVTWQRQGNRFSILLKLPGGRQQRVDVEPSDHAAAERLLMISSICAKADPGYYEAALKLNAETLHGALAIRNIQGEPAFVMLNNYPRATVDAEEIRRSVLEMAHRADAFERLLTNHDHH
jgi:eukaryotic-like serine/threonine-protein kinase